ncbi:5' nucleotidase, NT5C type [Pseudomonas aeruginosa]|uniref:5' nucleotidase, NT5C type n=1 Tax=Pseudomonas aeruginosa TaxID=287 RepID=UPI002554A607|nr:hypothetical protein [Pseudomonas aeruginosa]
MDHVLCDYQSAYDSAKKCSPELLYPQSVPGFFLNLSPLAGAIKGYRWLSSHPYIKPLILTAPSTLNPHCYTEKRLWVEKHLGIEAVEDLIISPYKHLNAGDYLVDDQIAGRGQEWFRGELIQFGSKSVPNWDSVISNLSMKLQR